MFWNMVHDSGQVFVLDVEGVSAMFQVFNFKRHIQSVSKMCARSANV